MTRKPWPLTMIIAVVLAALVLAVDVVMAGWFIIQDVVQPTATLHGLLTVVGVMLLVPGVILAVILIFLLKRRSWSRTALTIGVGVWVMYLVTADSVATSMWVATVPLVICAVLVWLPMSRPYFIDQPQNPKSEPTGMQDWS